MRSTDFRRRKDVDIRIKERTSVRYNVISARPLVIMTVNIEEVEKFILLNDLKEKTVYFLIKLYWSIEQYERFKEISHIHSYLTNKYRYINIIFLCNTEKELQAVTQEKIEAIYCNSNCLIDENIFTIIPVEKEYDAIYNARFSWFKRHDLARNIKSLSLLYSCGEMIEESDYFEQQKALLSHAVWLNELEGSYRKLGAKEIAFHLNKSRVGICLSAVEGANYATGEYLLCGLPVVSTKSIGGRDVFFGDRFALEVEDTAEAVRAGVEEMRQCSVSPTNIRSHTLAKMWEHRERFISLIQEIYDREQVHRSYKAEFARTFYNKFLRWGRIRDLQREILRIRLLRLLQPFRSPRIIKGLEDN